MTDGAGKRFVDVSGKAPDDPEAWEPTLFTAAEIEDEIERLAALPQPADGRRESLFVHPRSTAPGLGLAPGIRVALCVLKPGEATRPRRQNSTVVGFCIRGNGAAIVGGDRIPVVRYDAWNLPSYRTGWHVNEGDDLHVRLEYSNAPVLEKLHVHLVDPQPPEEPSIPDGRDDLEADGDPRRRSPYGTFEIDDSGASLMPYERLINPPAVASHALHWPWADVKAHLDELVALGPDYVGRRLYLLYNPMTGRTNGTTPSFFATITIRPPGIVDRPHRHVSAAINYFFEGSGWSRIAGQSTRGRRAISCSPRPDGRSTITRATMHPSTSSPCKISRSTSASSRCFGKKTFDGLRCCSARKRASRPTACDLVACVT